MAFRASRKVSIFSATLLAIEFVLVIATMSLLCCTYPERFRKTLWEIGGENGWNSNPHLRIYFYANYQQPPEIPLVWAQRLSESNLAISILATAMFSTRIALTYFDVAWGFSRLFNTANDVLLSGFWMYSVVAQSSSDLTDPDHLSVRPWYLEKSCNILDASGVEVCLLAKACFTLSVLSLIFFFARFVVSVLQFAYWCGQFQMFDRGMEMLCARLQKHPIDSGGGFIFSGGAQVDEYRDSVCNDGGVTYYRRGLTSIATDEVAV
ncbi:hypothetical protein F4804DRAFT_312129 [Jackrogersella minutella]|nr:hypothetical protein F4804DRAFT_312129 [Jackrogersella minutella]